RLQGDWSSDVCSSDLTLEGMITSWNAAATRLYGYAAEEVMGKPIAMLVPPDSLDELAEILERLRRGEHVEHRDTTRVRKDGTLEIGRASCRERGEGRG